MIGKEGMDGWNEELWTYLHPYLYSQTKSRILSECDFDAILTTSPSLDIGPWVNGQDLRLAGITEPIRDGGEHSC